MDDQQNNIIPIRVKAKDFTSSESGQRLIREALKEASKDISNLSKEGKIEPARLEMPMSI